MTVDVWHELALVGMAVLTVAAVRFAFMGSRKPDRLTYTVPRPERKRGMAGLGKQMGEAVEAMAYGTSCAEWKRRCQASLRASRRRRGLEP